MLKIHTSDGQTVRVDLDDAEQAKKWLEKLGDPRYQDTITGMTVVSRGVQYSLPRPVGFEPVNFLPELVVPDPASKIKGGERIVCFAGDNRVTLMVHRAQRAARVSLFRLGKQRFRPQAKGVEEDDSLSSKNRPTT